MASYQTDFAGNETTLDESGHWTAGPGAWGSITKNDGAFAPGTNAGHCGARLLSPTHGADQYVECEFSAAPATNDWYAVLARMSSSSNGAGYLAIVYQATVRLYKVDDSGSLGFTQIGSNVGVLVVSPYTLRMEVTGSGDISVRWNGVEVFDETDSTSPYTTGQTGFAVFEQDGNPTALSFDGGDLGGGTSIAVVAHHRQRNF